MWSGCYGLPQELQLGGFQLFGIFGDDEVVDYVLYVAIDKGL